MLERKPFHVVTHNYSKQGNIRQWYSDIVSVNHLGGSNWLVVPQRRFKKVSEGRRFVWFKFV